MKEKLTDKQKVFIDSYCGSARFHATKAAVMAGYSEKTAYSIGSENLKKPEIRKVINERINEMCLGSNEVLARLTDIANGSIEDLLDEDGYFDFKAAKRTGKLPLVKKLKRKTTSKQVEAKEEGGDSILETSLILDEVEFEMYSAHEALRDLGKYHKLFVERHEVEGNIGTYTMTKEEWEKEAEKKIKQVTNRLKDK